MWRDNKGAVYVEFLLVFPPIFLLFLVILQSVMLRTTDIGVRHAASGAVRSAIVVLPDDPVAYKKELKNKITMESDCSEGFSGKFRKVLSKLGMDTFDVPKSGKCPGGERLAAIRFGAIMRMLPFSPNPGSILPAGLGKGLESLGAAGWLAGAAAYSYGATAVTFPESHGSAKRKENLSWTHQQDVTVRVSYLAHCGIPIARFFMCDSSYSLLTDFDVDFYKRDFKGFQAAQKRIHGSQSALSQMQVSVGNSAIFFGLLASGERFRVLSADATLPLNSAPYAYKVKKD